MPEQVSVDLAERSYEIYVGANLLEQAHTYIDPFSALSCCHYYGRKCCKISSCNVANGAGAKSSEK